MLTYEKHLHLFHEGHDSETAKGTYKIEHNVNALMGCITRYPINYATLLSLESEAVNAIASLGLKKDASFNPNSNKDVASKLETLHLGVVIPRTAKGNISLTKDWFDQHQGVHTFIDTIGSWREHNRKLQSIEQIKKNLTGDQNHIHTTWRTFSDKGSGSIISEAYPVANTPSDLRGIFVAPEDAKWIQVNLDYLHLEIMAHISRDLTLSDDLSQEDPLSAMASRLHLKPEVASAFIESIISDFDSIAISDFQTIFGSAYPQASKHILGKFPPSSVLALDFYERFRNFNLDPEIKSLTPGKIIETLFYQNATYAIKNLICSLISFHPVLKTHLWIPLQTGLAFTCPLDEVDSVRDFFKLGVPLTKCSVLVGDTWPSK